MDLIAALIQPAAPEPGHDLQISESSRGGGGCCGCGGGSGDLALPLLLGALFLATAFLNSQIIMAGEDKRKKRFIELSKLCMHSGQNAYVQICQYFPLCNVLSGILNPNPVYSRWPSGLTLWRSSNKMNTFIMLYFLLANRSVIFKGWMRHYFSVLHTEGQIKEKKLLSV